MGTKLAQANTSRKKYIPSLEVKVKSKSIFEKKIKVKVRSKSIFEKNFK